MSTDPAFLSDRRLWELELERRARLNRIEQETNELIASDPDLVEFMYKSPIFDLLRPYIKIHDRHDEARLKEFLTRLWADCKMSQVEYEMLETVVLDGLLLRNIGLTLYNAAEKCAEGMV